MMKIFHRYRRLIAAFLLVEMLFQVVCPSAVYALTSGPSQPEVQGFQAAGTSDMVDLFSGDFSYNIPLFELPGPNGGYPFNLSYQSGIAMDAEASWVGLGFSLNPGAINRQMRGLPDEFKGDEIFTKMALAPTVTAGLGAGVSVELFGASGDVGIGSASLGLGVYYNNFKGFGYSIDAGVGFHTANSSGNTAGIGLNVKLDSQEGVSASPNLSLGNQRFGNIGVSVGYNSKTGLNSVSMTHSLDTYVINEKKRFEKGETIGSSSASLSFAHPGYTPQVSVPMRNMNLAARFQPGGEWWGIFAKGYIHGFYNEQWLHNNKKRVSSQAYGYLNYDAAQGNGSAVLDFNREKEGMVTKVSPNLAIPALTYDIYSVTGQGISAMYRPMRNDYGIVYDPETESTSTGGSAGVDVGVWASKVGVNLNVNHGRSTSGKWTDDNGMNGLSQFQSKKASDPYEPAYFKIHGENTALPSAVLDNLGGTGAVRVRLDGSGSSASASSVLEGKNWSRTLPNAAMEDRDRKPRSQVIETITNAELLAGGTESIPTLKVKYIDAGGSEVPYVRDAPSHHIAAFTALTPEGLRYNYGIPAYNLKQEEVAFSVEKQTGARVDAGESGNGDPRYNYDGTEKYLKRVEIPKYAHSYLLTSIVGPDYVDVLGDGVTEDDLGYWVKFTYKKTTTAADSYKWRDPYSKANHQEGWKTDPRDDKASFVYGEKEMWYLVRAETKSHIASFTLEERDDAMGVAAKLQDHNDKGKRTYALRGIKLFARTATSSQPIKTVKFAYDYSLCPGIYNSRNNGGKLTLKSVWFEYGTSTRGRLNPYIFTYHPNNPHYDQRSYDRWGNYKPYPGTDSLYNIDFPYAEQDPAKKSTIDANAAAWSLKEIQLPSGGKIVIDYESDDYAYVQHLSAMQMTEIINPEGDAAPGSRFMLKDDGLIRFRLETPISGTLTAAQQRNEVMKYLDQKRKQLYFKILVNLQKPGQGFNEYISGYADINFSPDATMALHTDASGKYVYGSFYVNIEKGFHPFSLRAWQHIRTNQPELAYPGSKLTQTSDIKDQISQITALSAVFTHVRQMFEGFYNYCRDLKWGREITAGRSWVRLNSPDKIKYGGGLRVKQIAMYDNWAEDAEGAYGQVYDYTIAEGNSTISSGVAAYEPVIGGEENPLRYAKKFTESVPLRSDNNMFFEYPINESYYPGPQVGYRKVTVMSLAAAALAGKPVNLPPAPDGKPILPRKYGNDNVSFGTTGMTVHEFYTAKDFPVITDETEKTNKPYQLSVPIPFLGNVSVSKLTASQGYSILTNDMHGKQKQVSTYRQDRQGKIEEEPISWVKYHYMQQEKTYEQEAVAMVTGLFKDNGDGTLSVVTDAEVNNPSVKTYSIGQETELILDMRQNEDNTWEGGVSVNTDILYIPVVFGVIVIPAFVPWPSIGKTSQQLRTAVTNKVIYRTGILAYTEAYDGGSTMRTENLKWDKLTGGVVLSKVNNNFDASVYSLSIPAYKQYQGMGAAFTNIGLTFSVSGLEKLEADGSVYVFTPSVGVDKLFPGDELLLYAAGGDFTSPVGRVVFAGEEDGELLLYSKDALAATAYNARIVRSGYRNQLSIPAGNITALEDPTHATGSKTYSKIIQIPNE